MSNGDEWSPDEALGTEAFEQSDEAVDEENRLDPGFADAVQGDPSIDPENELDDLELEEAGVALDDPEVMLILQGGGDDPDGMGGPPNSARAPEEPGWDLDGTNVADDDEAARS